MKKLLLVLIVLLMCICAHSTISADFDGPYFTSPEFESWDKSLPPWDSSNWVVVDDKSRLYRLGDKKVVFITLVDFCVTSNCDDKVRVLFYSRSNLRDNKKNILKIGTKDSIPKPQFAIVALPSRWTDYVSICAYQIKDKKNIIFDSWLVPLTELTLIVPRRIFEKALLSVCKLDELDKSLIHHYNDLPVHWLYLKVVDERYFINIYF